MISSLDPHIQNVIRDWDNARGPYTFEIRIHPILNPSTVTSSTPFVFLTFIIEVKGFFLDKEHQQPIKLHHERVISIDRFNPDPQQYAKDLRGDLALLTKAAYAQFAATLASLPQPTYTSDPLHMKRIAE